jgi:ribosomal protein S12 methylthiotransferase accessory factor
MLESIEGTPATLDFRECVTFEGDTLNADVKWELERLRAAGIRQVAVVDLTKRALGLPVVRVVIPGLEGIPDATGYIPGRRYREAVTS